MNRRDLIKNIGKAICVGAAVPFVPSLLHISTGSVTSIGSNGIGQYLKIVSRPHIIAPLNAERTT